MNKIKILLADDHQMIRDGLKLLLKPIKNFDIVAEAANGKEVINYLEDNEENIDVIIMDITMPELNGVDATEIIMKLYPNIKILGLTMHTEETYILKMIKAGAKGYVLKDTTKEVLTEAINTIMSGDKYYCNEVSTKLINALIFNDKPKENKFGLTDRELQVIKWITKGKTNNEIATYLELSRRTIEAHRNNIQKKLGVNTTAELIVFAIENNLVK